MKNLGNQPLIAWGARVLGLVLIFGLVAACGGNGGRSSGGGGGGEGGSGSGGGVADDDAVAVCRPIPDDVIQEARSQVDGNTDSGEGNGRIPYPEAGSSNFQDHLVFPLSTDDQRALIRSNDGCEYVYLELVPPLPESEEMIVNEWTFSTAGASAISVSENVASLSLVVNADDNGLKVKGARAEVTRHDLDQNNPPLNYQVDAYIFEAHYSGLAMWLEYPNELFGDGEYAPNRLFGYYGEATPASVVPSAGIVEYRGGAVGFYARNIPSNGQIGAGDRFFIGGQVTLNVNFAESKIGGVANLNAYNMDFSPVSGELSLNLDGEDTIIQQLGGEGPMRFRVGKIDIPVSGTGVFEQFTQDPEDGYESQFFQGVFTGPNANEAVGNAILLTNPDPQTRGRDGLLEFGFITRRHQP